MSAAEAAFGDIIVLALSLLDAPLLPVEEVGHSDRHKRCADSFLLLEWASVWFLMSSSVTGGSLLPEEL
jgi:hypothetical protein